MIASTPLVPQPERSTQPPRPGHRPAPLRSLMMAMALVLVFGAGVGADRAAWHGGPIAGASSSFTGSEEFKVLQSTWDIIHQQYADPKAIDDTKLIYGAASGMVDALGDDGHSRFLDPAEARDFEEATQGKLTGIGVEVDFPGDRPLVIAPIDGSPVAAAGVRSGDTILDVDGQSTARLDQERIGDLIRGEAGTTVRITFLHRGDETPYTVTLTRETITLQPVSWRMLPNGVAQIRVAEFSTGATDALKRALADVRALGAESLILDLRDDPGGLVSEAVGVASQFMPEGTPIFQQQERDGKAKPIDTVGIDGLWLDKPLVVLTNVGSASAAEIVAASLRDNHRATLVGETTYGTGTVLIPFMQPDGSVVLLGTALWLTADGHQIWKQGVRPDQEVALSAIDVPSRPGDDPNLTASELATSGDTQLRAAYADLTGTPATVPIPKPPGLP